jgi:hypothetical protein
VGWGGGERWRLAPQRRVAGPLQRRRRGLAAEWRGHAVVNARMRSARRVRDGLRPGPPRRRHPTPPLRGGRSEELVAEAMGRGRGGGGGGDWGRTGGGHGRGGGVVVALVGRLGRLFIRVADGPGVECVATWPFKLHA